MHSSISNSEAGTSQAGNATRAIAALLIGLSLYCLVLEGVTRVGFARISHIRKRIQEDIVVARTLKPLGPTGKPTMLVVGNSLLLEGVDRDALKNDLAGKFDVTLLPIENTQFEDWFFGLRRLFANGSRPTVVVACLTTRHMISSTTNGEHFAYFLMGIGDLLNVKNASHLDNTMTSAYFFANFSEWLGTRAQIRNWLLPKVLPAVAQVANHFPPKPLPIPSPDKVVETAIPHLQALNELCKQYGAKLVVIIPPTLSDEGVGSEEVQKAAATDGLQVLAPIPSGELPATDFRDGFHLNAQGMALFTKRLGDTLATTLGK